MNTHRTINHCESIEQPAAVVQDLLRAGAARIFTRATCRATAREQSFCVRLHMQVGSLDIATAASVQIGPIEESPPSPFGAQVIAIPLTWSAVSSPGLFPRMRASVFVYPLSSRETFLDFEGEYTPPLGRFGEAIDAVVGHRIAQACVAHFMQDVAAFLREQLSRSAHPYPSSAIRSTSPFRRRT